MGRDDKRRKEALEKIQRATADLASAFSTLGAFGTATLVSLLHNSSLFLCSRVFTYIF